jgi:copper homeostasis protein
MVREPTFLICIEITLSDAGFSRGYCETCMREAFLFELCADSLEAARTAQAGGADRIELCAELAIDGVTPSDALLIATLDAVSIPVHVLIRPRGGDFVYSQAEFNLMVSQTKQAKAAGAAGVAIGILLPEGRVDVERTRELAELARPMKVTFHRAFDETANLTANIEEALEDVIRTGADSLLTSGGAANVLEGAEQIGRLQVQAGDRLEIMAGGGLKLTNLQEVVRRSRVTCLHGSLSRTRGSHIPGEPGRRSVYEEDVREAIRLLQLECLEPAR